VIFICLGRTRRCRNKVFLANTKPASGMTGVGHSVRTLLAGNIERLAGGRSIPRSAFGAAMLTLLRLPFLPVSASPDSLRFAPPTRQFSGYLRPGSFFKIMVGGRARPSGDDLCFCSYPRFPCLRPSEQTSYAETAHDLTRYADYASIEPGQSRVAAINGVGAGPNSPRLRTTQAFR
jgi:hypothetical protein